MLKSVLKEAAERSGHYKPHLQHYKLKPTANRHKARSSLPSKLTLD